ncbi:hypothetical protein GSI_10076 [Ganoderma sinense ZZ0214-1]|uniref:BTB domain-containing protein n=1 Tax=Ganoderma sinense ZZ0214-1 TaxID=1077348 RepID=A0A2G8S056_9APHY|nr:hypothetical protein GSI_10076 [Ganoderma sinense ZZ0214-1]
MSSTTTSDLPQKYQLYRVHRAVLCHNSPVLSHLFSDAAPVDHYDGVPLVEMIGDSAEALASLLAFIYDPSEVNVRRWDPDTPLTVSPAVRIANKYLVDGLRAYLVQKVKDNWPLTIEDWDRREAEIEAMRSVKATSGERPPSTKPLARSVPEPASAIRFAHEFGCPEILPAAFYQLSRMDATYDWDRAESYDAHQDLPARWSLLDAPDLLRVLRGKQKLAKHTGSFGDNNYTYSIILIPPCFPWWEDARYAEETEVELMRFGRPTLDPKEYPCFALLSTIFSRAFREVSPRVGDPLKAMKECLREYERISDVSSASPKSLCVHCERGLKWWVPWARRYLWEQLPVIFALSTPDHEV